LGSDGFFHGMVEVGLQPVVLENLEFFVLLSGVFEGKLVRDFSGVGNY